MKKKIVNRIGVFLCALVVLFGSFCVEPYFADFSKLSAEEWFYSTKLQELKYDGEVSLQLPSIINDYNYYSVWYSCTTGNFVLCCSDKVSYVYGRDGVDLMLGLSYAFSPWCTIASSDGVNWSEDLDATLFSYLSAYSIDDNGIATRYQDNVRFVTSNHDIIGKNSGLVFFKAGEVAGSGGFFDAELGYLKNISVKNEYLRGSATVGGFDVPLYYDDATDTLKKVWTFDNLTTTDLDLSKGGYTVRHYVKEATVKGYKESDIIEMSDMYLVGEYDASAQRIEYLEKDHDAKLEELGYDSVGFVDKYLKGYFQLEHHYFQLVNDDTGEVGGYLHVYPKNDDGTIGTDFVNDWDKGTQLGYEGLDEDMNKDEDAPSGTVDEKDGYGETYEEAEQDAEEGKMDLGDLEGVEQFTKALKTLTKSVKNVSSALGSILELFPSWMLLGFAITFGLLVLLILMKVFRG